MASLGGTTAGPRHWRDPLTKILPEGPGAQYRMSLTLTPVMVDVEQEGCLESHVLLLQVSCHESKSWDLPEFRVLLIKEWSGAHSWVLPSEGCLWPIDELSYSRRVWFRGLTRLSITTSDIFAAFVSCLVFDIPATLCGLGLGIIGYLYFKQNEARNLPLPPGPKKLPIIGNAMNMPKSFEWVAYARWSKEYDSGIIHVDSFGKSIIIINSYRIAKELLDRRAIIYSGRPALIMLNDLMGARDFFAHMQYGEAWKRRRSLFHRHLHPSQTSRYQPHALRAVRGYLHLFLDDPENFMQHNRDLVGAAATATAYGIKVLKKNDPYILNAEQASHGLTQAMFPGLFLVESIPMLKYVPEWMPGARFQRLAAKWRDSIRDMVDLPFEELKRDRMDGRNALEPSFASRCLDNIGGVEGGVAEEELIKRSVGNIYFAAVDTSGSSLSTFILALVLYPDVQIKAQEELDRILPPGELPDFSYESSLPYVSAVVKEIIRWQPVAPVGVPHRLIQDDEFEGYRLPRNSTVIANAWAMLYDEETYPEPHVFKPERFLKDDGTIDPDVRDPSVTGTFGFGRRICPGAHVAKSMIWIYVASMLSTMTIGKARDENGIEITPFPAYTSATISHPLPFRCTIRPRSKEAEALVRSSADSESATFQPNHSV